MQKGARLAGELTTVNELLLGSEGGLSQLRQAARRLDRMAAEHPLLAEALASLDRAVIEAIEAEEKLDAASDALSIDPARLDSIETRLFDPRGMARKNRGEAAHLWAVSRELHENGKGAWRGRVGQKV